MQLLVQPPLPLPTVAVGARGHWEPSSAVPTIPDLPFAISQTLNLSLPVLPHRSQPPPVGARALRLPKPDMVFPFSKPSRARAVLADLHFPAIPGTSDSLEGEYNPPEVL